MENELVRVTVLTSKGADILEFRYKPNDTDVLWHAPQPILPPTFVPTKARSGGAFSITIPADGRRFSHLPATR